MSSYFCNVVVDVCEWFCSIVVSVFVDVRLRLGLRCDEKRASEEAKVHPKWCKIVVKFGLSGGSGAFRGPFGTKKRPRGGLGGFSGGAQRAPRQKKNSLRRS